MYVKQRIQTTVVAQGVGVSVSTRLRLTECELAVLADAIAHTTRVRNRDLSRHKQTPTERYLAAKLDTGDSDLPSKMVQSAVRDNTRLAATARRNLIRHIRSLREAVHTVERKLEIPTRDVCKHVPLGGVKPKRSKPCPDCRSGYNTKHIRAMKARRLDQLRAELTSSQKRLADKDYRLLPGGHRRANTRHHLDQAGITAQQWRDEWDTARAWFAMDGNTGVIGGNHYFRLDHTTGLLSIRIPKAEALKHGLPMGKANSGGWLTLRVPVLFKHLTAEVASYSCSCVKPSGSPSLCFLCQSSRGVVDRTLP